MTDQVLVYDLEATGVDPEKDRMVSLAIVDLQGKTVLNIIVDPGIPMPAGAAAVHGITDEKLAELGGRPFRDHADQVQEIVHGKILAGYNSRSYDAVLLDRELKRADRVGLDLENVVEIDAHRVWIEREPRTLSGAYQHFCGKELAGAHDALEDAKATAAVIASMGAAFGLTADEMAKLSKPPWEVDRAGKFKRDELTGKIVFGFGKHRDRPAASQRSYLDWMLGAGFSDDTKSCIRDILAGRI